MPRAVRLANWTLAAGALLGLVAFAYSLQVGRTAVGGNLLAYRVASLTGAALCLLALRLPPRSRVHVTLAAVSVVAGVSLFEIVLFARFGVLPTEIQVANVQRARVARSRGVEFDVRTPVQVLRDLRRDGSDVVPHVSPRLFVELDGLEAGSGRLYPLGQISRRRVLLCNESGEYRIVRTDERGFNNPAGLHERGRVSVVILGDSFAQGVCVPAGQDVAGRLREARRSALTLGMSGTGPLLQLAALTEYGLPLAPEIVVWMYFEENDLRDLLRERQSSHLLRYLERGFSQGLRDRQSELDRALADYSEERTRRAVEAAEARDPATARFTIALSQMLRLHHLRLRLGLDRPQLQPDALFERILAEAAARVRSAGGRLVFVYLPGWERYAVKARFPREQVLAVARRLDLPTLDFHSELSDEPDPLALFPFGVSGHYTAEGYRRLAQGVDSLLSELESPR